VPLPLCTRQPTASRRHGAVRRRPRAEACAGGPTGLKAFHSKEINERLMIMFATSRRTDYLDLAAGSDLAPLPPSRGVPGRLPAAGRATEASHVPCLRGGRADKEDAATCTWRTYRCAGAARRDKRRRGRRGVLRG